MCRTDMRKGALDLCTGTGAQAWAGVYCIHMSAEGSFHVARKAGEQCLGSGLAGQKAGVSHLGAKSAPERAVVRRRHIQALSVRAILISEEHSHRPAPISHVRQAYCQDSAIRGETCVYTQF